ncbi:MAG: glycosyltransferase [Verrucomicrobiae bacterium]|nr:glycosyltransferase [Verrucomicrobiae bacterium]
MKVTVLSSARKERDGIAEYTRQLFNPAFWQGQDLQIEVWDVTLGNLLKAPFARANVIHVQHEFFLFDRLVGVTAFLFYPYLWFWCRLFGCKLVTTIHSTYNVDDLPSALPHFAKYRVLFPLGRIYLKLHFKMVVACSDRIVLLSKIGATHLQRAISRRQFDNKVVRVHLGNYLANIRMQTHGLLAERFGVASTEKLFTLFGFAWPNKGYEYGIHAFDLLVNQRGRKDIRLVVVSGEAGKSSFPGGGQGESYIGYLKRLTRELRLEERVIFTGYLANEDPLLEEIFATTFCFLFPYLNRNFPSGAISTVLATRKPVLVSRIPCFAEYENLPAFEEKNAADLADKMTALMEEPQFLAEAVRITQYNADTFAMAQIFARHLEIYRQLLSR